MSNQSIGNQLCLPNDMTNTIHLNHLSLNACSNVKSAASRNYLNNLLSANLHNIPNTNCSHINNIGIKLCPNVTSELNKPKNMSPLFLNVPCNPNPSSPVTSCTNNNACKFVTPQWNNNDIEDESCNILEYDTDIVTQ